MSNLIHMCARAIGQRFFSLHTSVRAEPAQNRINILWEGEPNYAVFFTEGEMLYLQDHFQTAMINEPNDTDIFKLDQLQQRFVV